MWDPRQQRLPNDLQTDFSLESQEMAVRLLGRLRAHTQILRGVDCPGMQGLGYAARIPASDVPPNPKKCHLCSS